MQYICKKCNKNYSSYQSLWIHNKKYHTAITTRIVTNVGKMPTNCHPIVTQINEKTYKCKHCGKVYNNRNSKYKHQVKCTNIITILTNKIDELESKINNKSIINTKINNNNKNNRINNGTINHITINKVGTELLERLTNKDIDKIFDKEIESIFTFIELLNFNSDYPENHNHCVTNLESKFVSIYNSETKKIEKDRKKYFFDSLLCKSIDRMNILFNNNKDKFTITKQNEITNTIDTLNRLKDSYYNPKLFNELISKLNLVAYNNKDIVIDTWNNTTETFEDDLNDMNIDELLSERKRRMQPDIIDKE